MHDLIQMVMQGLDVMVQQQQSGALGEMMNDYDRSNLDFLLSINKATLKDWYNKMSSDDIDYASEIMTLYSAELAMKSALLNDDVADISAANKILKQFRL